MGSGMPATGLRERKKRATHRAIVAAGLRLFEERGFHRTSIPAIAEAAEVSPRTVSHYFPAKEQILFSEDLARSVRLERWLGERDPDQTTTEAFRAWLEHEVPLALEVAREESAHRRRIIDADPDLQAAERRYAARGERALAEAFAADPDTPSPLQARMAAAALLAVFAVVVAEWEARLVAEPERDRSRDVHLLDDALRFVEAGLHELRSSDARSRADPPTETRGP
jgi:AcrR family transcriptional regulator